MNFMHVVGARTMARIKELNNLKLDSTEQYEEILGGLGNPIPHIAKCTLVLISAFKFVTFLGLF